MTKLQPVRGTHDLLPDEMRRHRRVIETARDSVARFGYREMATPIFEFSEVFKRTLGDTSDIVTKEMYSFVDRGGEGLTLRPEGTAGVARALISGGLTQSLPLKFFYAGPMFRYERPQKGRLRQFHQTGIELLGIAEPEGDVEVIAAGVEFLDRLGLAGRYRLEINSLGDAESRAAYRRVLVDYLRPLADRLSAESRDRLERNPLRILDSKDEGDRRLLAEAPRYENYLSPPSRDFFAAVKSGLDDLGITYRVDPALVRGLDYYCHTCFEIVAEELGAQKTILAGGRYDGLVELMGGPAIPGIGWASGIERCALLLGDLSPETPIIAIIPAGAVAETPARLLAQRLRRADFSVDLGFSGSLGKRLKRADKIGARIALILGETELAAGQAILRDLVSGEQKAVALDRLEDALRGLA